MRDPSPRDTASGFGGDGTSGGRGGRMMLVLMNVRTPGVTPSVEGGTRDRVDSAATDADDNAAAAAAITPEKEGGGGRDVAEDGESPSSNTKDAEGVTPSTSTVADGGAHANDDAPSAFEVLFPSKSSLDGEEEEEGEGVCITSGLPTSRPCVVSLPDPAVAGEDANNHRKQYIYVPRSKNAGGCGDIYEMQQLRNPTSPTGPGGTSKSYGSFLVDSLVVSDGRFALVSRIDPLFFALSILGGGGRVLGGGNNEEEGGCKKKKYRWMPLDQILAELPAPVRMALVDDVATTKKSNSDSSDDYDSSSRPTPQKTYSQLDNIFESTDHMGDDLILYKFDEERTMRWLVEKHRRAVGVMRSRLLRRRRREEERRRVGGVDGAGGCGDRNNSAFSEAFTLPEEEDGGDHGDDNTNTDHNNPEASTDSMTESPDKIKEGEAMTTTTPAKAALDEEEERAAKVGALQLVCGYLPSQGWWRAKLATAVGLSESDVDATTSDRSKRRTDEKKNQSEKKRKARDWSGGGDGETDKLLQYTMGVDGNGGGAGDVSTAALIGDDEDENRTSKKRKAGSGPQSFGLKKLAKVNTKGMKSLSSFFGGGGGTKEKKQKVVTPCAGGGKGKP